MGFRSNPWIGNRFRFKKSQTGKTARKLFKHGMESLLHIKRLSSSNSLEDTAKESSYQAIADISEN